MYIYVCIFEVLGHIDISGLGACNEMIMDDDGQMIFGDLMGL